MVALLPVGALLFIGAGLLGAGTLKDLGLVLFIGMAVSFYSSLFFASPLLIELKLRQPRFRPTPSGCWPSGRARRTRSPASGRADRPRPTGRHRLRRLTLDPELVELAGAAPKVGARPVHSRRSGRRRSSGARRG